MIHVLNVWREHLWHLLFMGQLTVNVHKTTMGFDCQINVLGYQTSSSTPWPPILYARWCPFCYACWSTCWFISHINYGPIYLPETILVFFTNAIPGARKTTSAPAETPLGVGAAVPLEAGRSRRRPGCSWAEDLGSSPGFLVTFATWRTWKFGKRLGHGMTL
jgi:hypothetical protein